MKSKLLDFFLLASLLLSGCSSFLMDGRAKVVYENPKLASYSVKKVALLPMDDDTDSIHGTYYSTNHFSNILENDYPELAMSDIDKIREYDCSFLPAQTQSLKMKRKLDLKGFLYTDLGCVLSESNYDAVLIGELLDSMHSITLVYNYEQGKISLGKSTKCQVAYYLVSLQDGSILWKATSMGESVADLDSTGYPPIDMAISNAIDRIAEKLPLQIFRE